MKNKDVIDQINHFVDNVEQESPSRRDILSFNLQDVKINESFEIDGMEFTEKASDAILGVLNTKPSFKEFQSIMEQTDWNLVSNRLKSAKGDINLYGSLVQKEDGSHIVDGIFFKNVKKKQPDDLTNSRAIVNQICETLSTSSIDWTLKGINFDKESSNFELSLLNDSQPVDVLANDPWKFGQDMIFNSTQFQNSPFYERLVCTNGMRQTTGGWKSNISKATFTNAKINTAINNALNGIYDEAAQLLTQLSQHAKNNTISLREFYYYRKFFEKKGYDDILAKYFIEAPFYKAWGENVAEKDDTWKSTANANINAYDFINLNTWLASHTDKSHMTAGDAAELKLKIAYLFTAPQFDTEKIATPADVVFPHFAEMD